MTPEPLSRPLGSRLTSHLVLAGLFTLFAAWYAIDAWRAAATVYNLILIAPAAVCAVLIGGVLMLREIRSEEAPPPPPQQGTFAMMGLLAAFVALLPVIGFSASIFLFLAAGARLMGVRSPLSLVLYAGLFTLVVVIALSAAVRLPEPMILEMLRGGR